MKKLISLIIGAVFLSGCSFESDLDILNKFNAKYKQNYKVNSLQFFCFDVGGFPFVDGDLNEVNGVNYRCDAGKKSVWVEDIE